MYGRHLILNESQRLEIESSLDLEEECIAAQEKLERHAEFLAIREQVGKLKQKYLPPLCGYP